MSDPMFARVVPGVVITRTLSATTIAAHRDTVTVALGGHADFTVSLSADDLFELLTALLGGEVSYVSSSHPIHGRLLLNARPAGDRPHTLTSDPTELGPSELALTLPDQRTCQVLFDTEQAGDFVLHLRAAWTLLGGLPPRG
ncbi:hypothetical protein [Kutzneria sp. NPDC052558]|uniref:hypothetical protein n=1 Tax=Kutzneria sp. NPDC052558 TaxID=3364121 RepID=UPI0037C8AB9B